MNITPTKQQALNRSIQRLNQVLSYNSVPQLLSAFTYTNLLMDEYLDEEKNEVKRSYYLVTYQKIIEFFKKKIQKEKKEEIKHLSFNKKQIILDSLKYFEKFQRQSKQYQNIKKSLGGNDKKEFQESYIKMQKLYEEHNLDLATKEIQKLKFLKKQNKELKITKQMKDRIDRVEAQYLKMVEFSSYLEGEDWIFDKQQNGVRLQYKVLEEERTIGVRVQAEIDMQIIPFLSIISQIDFQDEYVPFVYEVYQQKRMARNRKAGYSKTYVPLLKDRECYFTAVGYNRMETTGSVFLYTETYDENSKFQKEYDLPVPSDKQSQFVRLVVHYFCIDYKPISLNRAIIRTVTKADFKLPFLPLFILQRTARIFTFDWFSGIIEKAKKYKGSKWEQRVKERPEMYQFFQQKVNQYFH